MSLVEELNKLTEAEKAAIKKALEEIRETGDASILEQMYSVDYERIPVSPRQFIEDDYYLGKTLKHLSPVLKDIFDEVFGLFSRVVTIILTGAIGYGKTTFAALCQVRKIYELSCLKDPAKFYGLLPGSKIIFGIYNITLDKADDTNEKICHFVDNCSYFSEICPRERRPKYPIFFPSKNIEVSLGSLGSHALGDDILSFTLDEANFYKKVRSVDLTTEQTRAHQLFNEAQTRLYSRFMRKGRVPGLVIIVSSKKFQTSFVDGLIERTKTNEDIAETTKIVELPLWVTKNPEDFSGENFKVLIGTDEYNSRVLEYDEVTFEEAHIVEIPVEYKRPFLDDCDLAIRDIAGISTKGSKAFFPVKQRVIDCIDYTRNHPFNKAEICIPLGSDHKIKDFLREKDVIYTSLSEKTPIIDAGRERYVHIDIAYSEENLGICMGHPIVMKNGKLGVYVDFMLRMRPPATGELDLDAPVDFVKYLRDELRFRIVKVTFDRFQSRMPIQRLVKAKFQAELLSIKLQHYIHLKTCFNEGRINLYEYIPMLEEIDGLVRNPDETKRPEHSINSYDDLLDALAGVVSCCFKIEGTSKKGGKEREVAIADSDSVYIAVLDRDEREFGY